MALSFFFLLLFPAGGRAPSCLRAPLCTCSHSSHGASCVTVTEALTHGDPGVHFHDIKRAAASWPSQLLLSAGLFPAFVFVFFCKWHFCKHPSHMFRCRCATVSPGDGSCGISVTTALVLEFVRFLFHCGFIPIGLFCRVWHILHLVNICWGRKGYLLTAGSRAAPSRARPRIQNSWQHTFPPPHSLSVHSHSLSCCFYIFVRH